MKKAITLAVLAAATLTAGTANARLFHRHHHLFHHMHHRHHYR